jgi:hypothetical protein
LTGAARESSIAQLADVQRQIGVAEARLAASKARVAELDQQMGDRLQNGSTRWTRREGVRALRRAAAGELGDWGHLFEGVIQGMAVLVGEARARRERKEQEDDSAALGDRELTSLRHCLEEL